MSSKRRVTVLQISHDYLGPFVGVCRQFNYAFSAGKCSTIYLRGEQSEEVTRETGGDSVIFFDNREGSLRGFKIKTLLRLAAHLRKNSPDIIIAHRYKALYLAGVMSYFFPRLLVIGVIHEHGVFKRLHRRLFLGIWCRNIKVLAVSETVKNDIARYCPFLEKDKRLHVQNNVLDHERYEPGILSREDARAYLGLGAQEIIIGTLGRLVRKKDHGELIRAIALINQPARCVIVGEGPMKAELEGLVASLQLQERVLFTGHVRNAYKYIRAFDLFVLCSRKEEAFGFVLLEAMLAQVPVLTSNCSGPMEVMGDCGYYYAKGSSEDLAVKVMYILGKEETEISDMASSAYNRLVEKFSFNAFGKSLLSIPFVKSKTERFGE